jgi:hypothetical protein
MKSFIIISLFYTVSIMAQNNLKFDDLFIDKTMRIDYHHTGDAVSELITIDRIYQQGIWAGSITNLIDPFNNGAYYYKIYDAGSGTLIYSKGFDSYFKEYQMSDEAINGIKKAYHETSLIPYPKNKIKFSVEKRDKENKLNEVFSTEIDPSDYYIIREPVIDKSVKVYKEIYNGDPHKKVDVVILGEGYTESEISKFERDLKRYATLLVSHEPFKSHKEAFNIYGVLKPSEESGTDEPGAGIYRNTAINTTFYSLGSERYLLTEDNKTMRDLAAFVPYDAIFIMVNTPRYGGGGIYNFFCTFVSDNQFSDYVFLHEFGHSFGGLADEYYTSDVAYNEFYPRGVEPVEPNITYLLDRNNLKWKKYVSEGVEIPTPWEKEDFDKMSSAWQLIRSDMNKKIAEMKMNKAPQAEIDKLQEEYNRLDKKNSDEVDRYLRNSRFWNKTGAYEGAGYSSKDMYRPELDCLMFSKGTKPFCSVCEKHVEDVIKFYTE